MNIYPTPEEVYGDAYPSRLLDRWMEQAESGKIMRVTNGHKITLPKEACKDLDLHEGDYVKVEWEASA